MSVSVDDPVAGAPPSGGNPQGTLGGSAELEARFAQLELQLGRSESADANPARLGVCATVVPGTSAREQPLPAEVTWRADEQFPAASTIKVFVLQALMERVALNELSLDYEVEVRAEDLVTGSGVLKALTPGRGYLLRDLATLMIVVSDNTATNVLIDAVGLERINASIGSHGWSSTHLSGKLQVQRAASGSKTSSSVTSPANLVDYFARLWAGELLPPALTATCQAIYRRQQVSELGRALDYDPYSVEMGVAPWRLASKSGSLRGVRNDAGVLEPLNGFPAMVMAVMSAGCPDERFHPENLGARVVGLAAAAVHARLTP